MDDAIEAFCEGFALGAFRFDRHVSQKKGAGVSALDLLVKRCARRDTRPLLRDGDPREILAGLMDERYPIYRQADITVETDDGPHTDTVERIISALEAHKSERAPL